MADATDMTQLLALILGNASKDAQKQNNTNDTNAVSLAGDALNRDKFGVSAPASRLASSTRASVLSNFTPRHTQWAGPGSGLRGEVPTITGGIDQSLANLDPSTKSLAQLVMKDQLAGQQAGGITGGKADYKLPAIGQESATDKLLGGGSTVAAILAALLGKGGSSGGSGGGGSQSGGKLPVQELIDWFKNRGGGSIPTPPTGTGVLDPGTMEGLGPGNGPRLPSGPEEPTGQVPAETGLSQELIDQFFGNNNQGGPTGNGDEWNYGPDPSTSDEGGS